MNYSTHMKRFLTLTLVTFMGGPTAMGDQLRLNSEAFIKDVLFDQCLGYVMEGRTPFAEYTLHPMSASALNLSNHFDTSQLTRHHIFSDRYIAEWGTVEHTIYCGIRFNYTSDSPPTLLVSKETSLKVFAQAAQKADFHPEDVPEQFAEPSAMVFPKWTKTVDLGTDHRLIALLVPWYKFGEMIEIGGLSITANAIE